MFKLIRRLIGGLLLLLIAAAVLLIPSSVSRNEQLKNIEARETLNSIVEANSSNANITEQGVSTELALNSVQFNQVLKTLMSDSQQQELLDSAYSLNGNQMRVQYPVRLGFFDSKLDLGLNVTVTDNVLRLRVENARLGSLPVPKSLVTSMLKSRLTKSNVGVETEGDQFLVALPQSIFSVNKANVQNGMLRLQLQMGYTGF